MSAKAPLRQKVIPAEVSALLAAVDLPTRERLEPRLIRAINACGCTSGAVVMMAGIVLSIVWWLVERDGRLLIWPAAGIAVVSVLAATAIGKFAGILGSRIWMAMMVRRLTRQGVQAAASATSSSP